MATKDLMEIVGLAVKYESMKELIPKMRSREDDYLLLISEIKHHFPTFQLSR